MEKDIGKIPKNDTTDIVVRIDDFGGRVGVTIREFVTSDRYTGFTKNGTRISADKFVDFREMVNAINLEELKKMQEQAESSDEGQEKIPETEGKAEI